MDSQALKIVSGAAGDTKALCDDLKAAGVTSPGLDAVEIAAGAVQQATASGSLDPAPLLASQAAEIAALRAALTDPGGKALLGFLARVLGKSVPPAPGA